ncbi:cytochrome-c peroxidase [Halocynthiibacter sp. C4]|uniref:cytochrome-c peroxidase n=1 Tax=Halocynthiibacter sp. C4 TaxID=2992758 RepID=UPI00237A6388|nr:cytochrome c peroxidase [Halocynthiibacter sp. C4]MDE0588606.1 cytochrome-c peroxidase [Halocynthiibacter sp. C4]
MRLAGMLAITIGVPALAGPLPDANAVFPEVSFESAELGQLLFYDPILSGNKNISCGTCHHPTLGTSDGVSLGIGEGGFGLGLHRMFDPENPPEERIPRNAPALWNLGATEFTRMFHDGRVELDPAEPNGVRTPLGEEMLAGAKNILAVQAMFPVLSGDEMAGHYSESDISKAARLGQNSQEGGVWDIIATRVASIPEYRERFDAIIGADQPIGYVDIANALADFIAFEWRSDDSPFDRHIKGEASLSGGALRGMELFYGKAECDSCHSGQFQTDHDFHAIAMPQIGPGKSAPFESHFRDTGRMLVTGAEADAYAFRTPSLRNVTVTAPYGHSGAYADLRDVVEHHLDPVASLRAYSTDRAALPEFAEAEDWHIVENEAEVNAIADANSLAPNSGLSDAEVDDILAFLAALKDDNDGRGRLGVPESVPSGLPLDAVTQ